MSPQAAFVMAFYSSCKCVDYIFITLHKHIPLDHSVRENLLSLAKYVTIQISGSVSCYFH